MARSSHLFDEAMTLSCRALAAEPGSGHAAHARAHAHYETGDHRAGLAWMDSWVSGPGRRIESLSHFSWHAALHELSLGDTAAVRRRYDASLRPEHAVGCRGLVDSGSLLVRWALSDGADVGDDLRVVADAAGPDALESPSTPFLAMHAAATLLALGDTGALRRLAARSRRHDHPTMREVVAPLADAMVLLATGRCGEGADALGRLMGVTWRLGGSDAQRELLEEVRIAACLRAGRYDDARLLLDRRLDRRPCPRDTAWRHSCGQLVAR